MKVIPYSEKKAEENIKTVGSIIYIDILLMFCLTKDNFLKDLQHIFFCLLKVDKLSTFNFRNFDRIKFSNVWMDFWTAFIC